jgi:hypothetical protein
MYSTLEEAKSEIWRRWNDKKLRHRVEEYLGGDIPAIFQQEPKGVLIRFVATPNYEFCNFAKLSKVLNISPVVAEYRSDKFCTVNPDKKYLGKISIYRGNNPFTCPERAEVKGYKIINFKEDEGKTIKSLNTVWGQSFVEFHHELTEKWLNGLQTFDISAWFARHGGKPDSFYSHILALFVCHGVQFENYHNEGNEAQFTQDIVRPAVEVVTNHFGVKPLIVPVVPINSEREPAWSWYSSAMECDVQRNMIPYYAKANISK